MNLKINNVKPDLQDGQEQYIIDANLILTKTEYLKVLSKSTHNMIEVDLK